MKDHLYRYAIYTVLLLASGFSLFLISSDNIAPFTTQATFHRGIVNIAPEVSGVITEVSAHNGQIVNAGDTLFSIDKHQYKIRVSEAKAALDQVLEANAALSQELLTAQQTLNQCQLSAKSRHLKQQRIASLYHKHLISQQHYDDANIAAEEASSAVASARANIARITAKLPHDSSDHTNAAMAIAMGRLNNALLDLQHTDITATSNGVVSNLQLQAGSYARAGERSLFLVNNKHCWLAADFNEKGINQLTVGKRVHVAFDALPGDVIEGSIKSIDRAVNDPSSPNNQLAFVTNDNRWIREQQKVRVRIELDNVPSNLISGARASVIVNTNNPLMSIVSDSWIQLVSTLRYVY
ncbi:HlyD family secretion protein [Sinobacterium caligoides]|nr:efflux RND transporter periplasmic adaptor subunit [Sinobacterium caligoides]